MEWRTRGAAWLLVVLGVAGCGDDSSEDEERKPDTGYGVAQPVPGTRSCLELCGRLGDCAEHLCNEDTDSSRYDGLGGLIASQCEATCTDSLLESAFTQAQWQCLFQSSCREVFDYDDCHAEGSYYCN